MRTSPLSWLLAFALGLLPALAGDDLGEVRRQLKFFAVHPQADVLRERLFEKLSGGESALEAGFTSVCEFHYLHHDPHGHAYADPAEMSLSLLRAAQRSGIGMTLILVGAGGGFALVMRTAGVDKQLAELAATAGLPLLVYGWLVSAFIRVATGSATVAITVASGFIAPVLAAHPGTSPELMVISIGCGSLFLSHLNDSGFWMVKECLGLTVGQTLRTWTITETLIGLSGLGMALLAEQVLRFFG
mgnify:CR=1 FL=1